MPPDLRCHGWLRRAVGLAALLLLASMPGICRAQAAAAATWSLVKTVADPEKKSRTDTSPYRPKDTDAYRAGVGTFSYESRREDGKHFQASVTFPAPPDRLQAGQEFTVTANATATDDAKSPSGGGVGINYWSDALTLVSKEDTGSVGRWSDGSFHPAIKRAFRFRVPADARDEFVVTCGVGSIQFSAVTEWHYKKGAALAATAATLLPPGKVEQGPSSLGGGGQGTQVLPCFGSDRGAGVTDRVAHLQWAQSRNSLQMADNLDGKLNLLFGCPGLTEEHASSAFATISVIVAKAMPDVRVFHGDAGVIGTDWAAHKRAFADRSGRIGVLLDNARWKTGLTITNLDQARQAEFFADVSVAIAQGAIVPR